MTVIKTCTAVFALTAFCATANAGTDLEDAISNGGTVLNSDQIAELIIGKVVTARAGEKTFRFFYDPDNIVQGELVSGGWSGAGAFAITDTNQVCVSMAADNGRFRCLTAVRSGEVVQKFNSSGDMTFELVAFEPATGL